MITEKDHSTEYWKKHLECLQSRLQELENSVSRILEINQFIPEKDKYLDVSNSCRFLGIGRNTIYALMREGKISYTVLGRQRRILISELKKYAKSNFIQSKKSIL
jgi:excisionase family DNA binding protein